MRIPSLAPIVATALLAACAQAPPAPGSGANATTSLVSMAGEGEFVEIERTPEHSIVQVRRAPAGSVPSSMYTLRGVCAVLKARNERFVSSTPVAGSARTYRLTFPASATTQELEGRGKSVASLSDCRALGY